MRFLLTQKSRFQVSILSLILISNLFSDKIQNTDCGSGYDSLKGIIKDSPFNPPYCDTRSVNTEKKTLLIIINNLNELFEKIEIPKTEKFFKNYIVQKILNNPHLNRYTITILYYERQDCFETFLKNKNIDANTTNIKKYGDSYIEKIKNGGKHIVLFHIPTNSGKSYTDIYKKIKKNLITLKTFEQYIKKLSTSNNIIIKEYFSKELEAIPTTELTEIFHQTNYFDDLIKTHPIPYQYHIKAYKLPVDQNRSNLRKYLSDNLSTLFNIQYQLNNYRYFRHHADQFKPIDNNTSIALQTLSQTYTKIMHHKTKRTNIYKKDLNNATISRIDQILPEQYKAYAGNEIISLPPAQLSLTIPNFNDKINPNKVFKIEIQSKIDIQNKGKLARIKNIIKFHDNKLSEQKKEIKILCDTYVNYPDLKFKNISNNYGSLLLTLPFSKYTQYQKIKGTGIIKNAICGYDLHTDKTLHVLCKDIEYTPIEISFEHND